MPDTIATVVEPEALYGRPVEAATRSAVVPTLLASFAVRDKVPRPVMVMGIDAEALPSADEILPALSQDRGGGESCDREWPGRAANTVW